MENEFGVRYSSPMKHVQKGWGYEKWIVNNEKYCGKLLYFNKGKKCSWHYHLKKEETFYIHSGKLHLIYGFEDDMTDADWNFYFTEGYSPIEAIEEAFEYHWSGDMSDGVVDYVYHAIHQLKRQEEKK